MKAFVTVTMLLISISALGHGAHHHNVQSKAEKESAPESERKQAISDISAVYDKKIRPIFQMKCAACHSIEVEAPWYASIPGVRQLVEGDMSEAQKHLDISRGFPFSGHGDIDSDLEAIRDEVKTGEMPPLRYRIIHWNSAITDAEKVVILKWVSESASKLNVVEQKKSGDKK